VTLTLGNANANWLTLGVEPVKGSVKLHPVLEEALEVGDLTDDALNEIINAVKDGSLLRIAGD